MNNIRYSVATLLVAFAFASCEDLNEVEIPAPVDDVPVLIDPVFGENCPLDTLPSTKVAEMTSENGTFNIPLYYDRAEGMDINLPYEDGPAETKAAQYGTVADLQNIVKTFKVTAWNPDNTKFIDNKAVTYNGSKWEIEGNPRWRFMETKTFLAIANLPTDPGYSPTVSCNSTSQTIAFNNYPLNAANQKDVLVGHYKGNGDKNSDGIGEGAATISFYHPLTAVKFVMGDLSGLTATSLNRITIEGVYNKGTVTATPGASPYFNWGSTRTGSATVSQNLSGLPAKGSALGEAFILIPQNIASKNVTIKLNVNTSNYGNVTLSTTLSSGTWDASKTNTYTLGFDFKYGSLTVTGDVNTDYLSQGTKTYSVTSDSPWKIQYTTDGGTTWADAKAGTKIGGWITFPVVSGVGKGSAETVTATVDKATGTTATTSSTSHTAALRNAEPRGTSSAPWDLSMHDIYGNPNSGGMTTANSYVVSAPGWYSFPLVYGNAIKNGATNTQAFAPNAAANGKNYLTPFIKHDGKGITSPYISGAATAKILYQDVPNSAIAGSCSIKGTGTSARVVFNVKQATMTQGNVTIIALSAASDTLWSWHIWVTDDDLQPLQATNKAGQTLGMMPVDLGWVDGEDATTSTGYPAKSLSIRFVQYKGTTVKRSVAKTAKRSSHFTSSSSHTGGSAPTYQWGRKDPISRLNSSGDGNVSGSGKGTDFSHYKLEGGGSEKPTWIYNVDPIDISFTIRNPWVAPYNKEGRSSSGDKDSNLWYRNKLSGVSGYCEYYNLYYNG